MNPGLPQPHEYAPGFAGYIAKVRSFADPVEKLEAQLEDVLSLRGLTEAQQMHRYAEGKWSIKEVLGHVTDAERIFTYRLLRIARKDQTPLPGFDENSYAEAAGSDKIPWPELLEEFTHVRKAAVLLLRHLPEDAWSRMGTSNDAPMSVRALAYIMVGHVAHHLDIVRERYL